MIDDADRAVKLLSALLSPEVAAAADRLRHGGIRLVHYTSAENALNIIGSREFWLRNVRCMNDYSEVQHGIGLLLKVFSENENGRRERLIGLLDQIAEGAARTAIAAFDEWIKVLPDGTFIGCLSEYEEDDTFGRLSMWRAYSANKAGVALVMNSYPFVNETDALKAYSVPVAYLTDAQFANTIDQSLEALAENLDSLRALNGDTIVHLVFWWLLVLSVSLKHPAFIEEREWRVIYIPSMEKSESITTSVECISGIPQIVERIPLMHDLDNGLDRADLDNLLHKLLIGPSQFPLVLYDAFVQALANQGVQNPQDRVAISFIPLRN